MEDISDFVVELTLGHQKGANMKFYFAGSIRAGREDVDLYKIIIDHLKTYGEVLTEHVGDYKLSIEGQEQALSTYPSGTIKSH